jgi:adenosylcobyric acid synthase
VHMNPVLLKPESDTGAQLIVRGKRVGTFTATAHVKDKRSLLDVAVESYRTLERQADLIIVEGAGSPAETNLREHDIANMGLAQPLNLPVVLVGDIDRGHVIASLVGAHAVLSAADRARIQGFIINRFRGEQRLFAPGLDTITSHTGWRSLGIVPWLPAAALLPSEDAVRLERNACEADTAARIKIAVPMLSRIANFDDFDPLRLEDAVQLVFVPPGQPLPADVSMIILPGTKATIADMQFFRAQGWDIDLLAHVRRGGRVLGICGGYQMLGHRIHDPEGIEGTTRSADGLGLLNIETVMTGDKQLRAVAGVTHHRTRFTGYEMHVGVTTGPGTETPFLRFHDGRQDGAVSADGQVCGCYVHGLFTQTNVRDGLLKDLGAHSNGRDYSAHVDAALDEIAATLERSLDIQTVERIARESRSAENR